MNERDKMDETVLLGHGSGGTMMKRIIDEVFFEAYADEELLEGNDAASLPAPAVGERIAYSTDSFVVTPHFFPGGDIGRLAVCGTVNDVATSGAVPKYLSCGFILEEGFPVADLKRICKSMAEMAKEAGVHIVTGDTKVVNRGHGDGVFINTSGIGFIPEGVSLSGAFCKPGDKILVTGTMGDHGITIMSCREELSFSADIQTDAAPLNHLIAEVIAAVSAIQRAGALLQRSMSLPPSRVSTSSLKRVLFPLRTQCWARAKCLATTCTRLPTRAKWCVWFLPSRLRPPWPPCVRTGTEPMPPSLVKWWKRRESATPVFPFAPGSAPCVSWTCS